MEVLEPDREPAQLRAVGLRHGPRLGGLDGQSNRRRAAPRGRGSTAPALERRAPNLRLTPGREGVVPLAALVRAVLRPLASDRVKGGRVLSPGRGGQVPGAGSGRGVAFDVVAGLVRRVHGIEREGHGYEIRVRDSPRRARPASARARCRRSPASAPEVPRWSSSWWVAGRSSSWSRESKSSRWVPRRALMWSWGSPRLRRKRRPAQAPRTPRPESACSSRRLRAARRASTTRSATGRSRRARPPLRRRR